MILNAIEEAKKTKKDVPVGCIITSGSKIIAAAHNMKEELKQTTAHAEIIAINTAQKKLNTWHLDDCEMYVTLEPCPMCAWAIIQSRIKTLYFGSYNTESGAFGSSINLKSNVNSELKVYGGIEEEKCDKLLNDFFMEIRAKNDY